MEVLFESLWHRLRTEAQASNCRHFAVAYLTDHEALYIAKGDFLVIDASDQSIAAGRTSARALEALIERGVAVYSLANLHAKIYVFDACVIIASSNLSTNSQMRLHEAGISTTESAQVKASRDHVIALGARAIRIDENFIRRIREIPVVSRFDYSSALPQGTDNEAEVPPLVYRLAESPTGAMLRAYFIALIQVQLGELRAGQPFHLWNGHFATHLKSGRLQKFGERFILTDEGVQYFSSAKESPRTELLNAFMRALTSGREIDLPPDLDQRRLVRI